jgi:DNA-binding transcriptional regulator/RsmH inhibitor MraZ
MARDIENKEWLNDYPQLKQVNTKNPFSVPDSYFEELDERITSAIKLDELKNTISTDCFTLPQNYFENLSDNIQSRIAVEDALNTENTGLNVPANYFEELSNNIQSRIAVEELLNTDNASLNVPTNYFEDLSSKIQSRIAVEEAVANAADTLTVPPAYFERLNKEILNKTVNQEVVKRKGVVIRMMSSRVFKYATAACVLVMIGTGVFFQMQSPESVHDSSFLHKQLSTIPVSDIQAYLRENVDGGDTQNAVTSENLPVSADELQAALDNYTEE